MSTRADERRWAQQLVETAYREGYIQGSRHPRGASVITKAGELSRLFWRTLENRLDTLTEGL